MTPGDIRLEPVPGGVTAPSGFRAAAGAGGIRQSGRPDVALIVADDACAVAGVFTRNLVAAAPVGVSREAVADGALQAVVVNSGNANACTGAPGLADARSMQAVTADMLGLEPGLVAVCSTGVIGVPLPLDRVLVGVTLAVASLSPDGGKDAAAAIMTTDTFAKESAYSASDGTATWVVGGTAKGSGMIRPDMATMLGFLTTDAPLTAQACDLLLRRVTDVSFNRLTVDGDTSTNDMVLMLANGAAGGDPIGPYDPRLDLVAAAAEAVCVDLARMIARDGEGATTLVDVVVRGAVSDEDASRVAFAVADSPLVKTAVFGRDPNWGRVAMAAGKSGARLDPDRLEIVLAGVPAMKAGTALLDFDEAAVCAAMDSDEVTIEVDLHLGSGEATVWTCDLSYDYVRINAQYRT